MAGPSAAWQNKVGHLPQRLRRMAFTRCREVAGRTARQQNEAVG
jgi:hypothetical protein